jgi:hypothetical protein
VGGTKKSQSGPPLIKRKSPSFEPQLKSSKFKPKCADSLHDQAFEKGLRFKKNLANKKWVIYPENHCI